LRAKIQHFFIKYYFFEKNNDNGNGNGNLNEEKGPSFRRNDGLGELC